MLQHQLQVFNSLTRSHEPFQPINPPFVGLYVCGPTVYGEPHLGHARTYVAFDVVYRYLLFLGYKVRYVRNITDVGHLESDGDTGEDKIAKLARTAQLEPMEVAELYTNQFNQALAKLNTLPPSITPRASGHILEQIEMIEVIIKQGLAYESNGSVYFDVLAYQERFQNYGQLSGRILDQLLAGAGENTRELDGQADKRNHNDFALWKKASEEHIMKWQAPWSLGFPGWHLECSAMSKKYLGEYFDIHGGGLDLQFPHHECEIAQSTAAHNHAPVKYWMHGNLLTVNGKKMGKSLGNFITLNQIFTGDHPALPQAFSPQTIRFFILQSQYRSTLDFSAEGLLAAQKGLNRLLESLKKLPELTSNPDAEAPAFDVQQWKAAALKAMDDDFNTAILIAHLFEISDVIKQLLAGKKSISATDLTELQTLVPALAFDVLGLQYPENEPASNDGSTAEAQLLELIIALRKQVREQKDWTTSDFIRDQLESIGFSIKDSKEGTAWEKIS